MESGRFVLYLALLQYSSARKKTSSTALPQIGRFVSEELSSSRCHRCNQMAWCAALVSGPKEHSVELRNGATNTNRPVGAVSVQTQAA